MSIYEYDEEIAKKTYFNDGKSFGKAATLLENVASIMDNLNVSLTKACELASLILVLNKFLSDTMFLKNYPSP